METNEKLCLGISLQDSLISDIFLKSTITEKVEIRRKSYSYTIEKNKAIFTFSYKIIEFSRKKSQNVCFELVFCLNFPLSLTLLEISKNISPKHSKKLT